MVNEKDILTKIEDGMFEKISEMRLSDGYYYDWGTVNDPMVRRQDFPSAEIMITAEENLDDAEGSWNSVYMNVATCMIRVRCELENQEEQPKYAINQELNRALTDLKRLFGINHTVSDQCETIMYRAFTKVNDLTNDIFRPSYIDTEWMIKYTQLRSDPSQYYN